MIGSGRRQAIEHPAVVLGATTLSIVLGAFPIFLTGAMAVFIRPELGFGESALGALATLYYLTSAITALPSGRLAERLGGPRAMALGAALSMAAMIGISVFATSWGRLAALLVLAGIGNGIAFPASNLALTRGFPPRRQGMGFAIKQSAGPFATLVSGAAVPLIGLTVGWRWAFAAAGLAAIPVIAGWNVRQGGPEVRRGSRSDVPGRPVWLLAFAAFCGVNATASLGAFYVESAVAGSIAPGAAGLLLSLGSAVGILCRLGWGWLGDRNPRHHFTLLAGILIAGAAGFLAMSRTTGVAQLLAVTMLVFGTGWAWPSLLNFAVVQRTWKAPGIASGIIGTGQYGGGILGPVVFGLLVERISYRAAWSFSATMLALAAAFVMLGGRALEQRIEAERSRV